MKTYKRSIRIPKRIGVSGLPEELSWEDEKTMFAVFHGWSNEKQGYAIIEYENGKMDLVPYFVVQFCVPLLTNEN